MAEENYRFVVCIDVPGTNLQSAYKNLRKFMRGDINVGWETSDEAFGPDGEAIDPDELQKAIVAELHEENPDG